PSLTQSPKNFGIWTGLTFPNLAVNFRLDYTFTEKISANIGLDGNAISTLGRLIGLKYKIYKFPKNGSSLILGADYDFTTSGISSITDEEANKTGVYTIPKNSYIIPNLGFTIFDRNKGEGILNGLSIALQFDYKIPISYNKVVHRSGEYSVTSEQAITRFANGGPNFSVRIGLWLGR
ncbi:MAG: hypothetical protein IT222_10680, partial [Crocinitomix sp.]|nr:hypothetical protein [Crocinitomix sp.]